MEDLQRGHILLTPEFISQHLSELEKEFDVFRLKIQNELKSLENESKPIIEKHRFDKNTGRCFIQLSKLSPSEKNLKKKFQKDFHSQNSLMMIKARLKTEMKFITPLLQMINHGILK